MDSLYQLGLVAAGMVEGGIYVGKALMYKNLVESFEKSEARTSAENHYFWTLLLPSPFDFIKLARDEYFFLKTTNSRNVNEFAKNPSATKLLTKADENYWTKLD